MSTASESSHHDEPKVNEEPVVKSKSSKTKDKENASKATKDKENVVSSKSKSGTTKGKRKKSKKHDFNAKPPPPTTKMTLRQLETRNAEKETEVVEELLDELHKKKASKGRMNAMERTALEGERFTKRGRH